MSYAAFLVYILVITTYRLPIGEVALVIGLAGLLFQLGTFRFPFFLVWFALNLGWAFVGYTQAQFPNAVSDALLDFGKLWLMALIAVNVLRTRNQIRLYMIVFLGGFALYPVRGTFVNYYVTHFTVFGRALWNYIYANPNDLAALTLLPLSMAAAIYVSERKGWVKLAALTGMVILPLLILMTQSRGAILALSAVVVIAFIGAWLRAGKAPTRGKRLKMLAVAVALTIGVGLAAPHSVWTRLEGLASLTTFGDEAGETQSLNARLQDVDEEGSARQRFEIWRVARAIIRDHPVTGVGLGSYPSVHKIYAQNGEFNRIARGARDTHSTYLNVLAETGVPGLLLFLLLIGSVSLQAERTRRRVKEFLPRAAAQLFFLELGLLAFCIAGIFDSLSQLSFLYLHLALLWAVADSASRQMAAVRGRAGTGRSARRWRRALAPIQPVREESA